MNRDNMITEESQKRQGTLVRRVALWIAVLTMVAGAGQVILPGRALEGLGLTADISSIFAFRLASLMIFCFGALLFHEVRETGVKARGVLWTGVQKVGAAVLLLSDEVDPIAWGVVTWDGFCGIFLLLLPGYRAGT